MASAYYTATKSLALTPGHTTSKLITVYRTFDAVGTALALFPLSLNGSRETGGRTFRSSRVSWASAANPATVPGARTLESGWCSGAIQNPKLAHRRPDQHPVRRMPPAGEAIWMTTPIGPTAWNVRHQPSDTSTVPLAFRNSNGALSCLTCHDPHQPREANGILVLRREAVSRVIPRLPHTVSRSHLELVSPVTCRKSQPAQT